MARPTKFSVTLGKEICSQLASGMSLREVCSADSMPERHTVIRWVLGQIEADGIDAFSTQYAQAREAQYELMFDECVDIADDGSNDYMTRQNKSGEDYEVVNNEAIQRSKMRIDTRLTILERMKPKKFGKLAQVDHTTNGKDITNPTADDLADKLKELGVEC